ncbi:NYN domain-containing protein [Polynucleobacter sp. MWH-Svant-W18]|uniref:NYN domain-containing protein n=1 Tax=Polynucleobacter sp. MWH-Svant-W18 TaxID=1855909 RepID=UPI001BFE326A|nr:NYN domain-containing protein [Polynucleobacter sp. MWH-Svant-W18]QWD78333.1 NYN domain-containing protein [Polynucleobacter sp. MWH-Svant-W18]
MLLGRQATFGWLCLFKDGKNIKTIVYIDGYNLYYGLLRGSNLKWLNIVNLFASYVLDKTALLVEVRYYTAPVLGRMSDDPRSTQRQRQYLQALKIMHPKTLIVIEGKILASKPHQRLVKPIPQAPELQIVQVYDFNEKKTDVNLASDLITGAWTSAYDQAVICSNDSDLEGALAAVKRHHPKLRIGIVAPIRSGDHRHISGDLARNADWKKILSVHHIAASQLPLSIPNSKLTKPESW